MWEPVTEGDQRVQALGAEINCCGNDEWRGRLCQYHQGWADGWDERDGEWTTPVLPAAILDHPYDTGCAHCRAGKDWGRSEQSKPV